MFAPSRAPAQTATLEQPAAPARVADVRGYIKRTWKTLTRSLADLPAAAPDPKMPHTPGDPWPVFIAANESRTRVEREVTRALSAARRSEIAITTLPADPAAITVHGLLYLPEPYVVPGGRFNEMYGWDSYFTTVGLLLDGERERARQMTDNHLYQVEYYGKVLNANRTYYLSRSQPPFLSRMVLDVYDVTRDRKWLRRRPAVDRALLHVLDLGAAPRRRHRSVALLRFRRRPGARSRGR